MGLCAGAPCDFARDYEVAQSPLMREIERRVRGSDYGGTSWTTRDQADATVSRLELAPGLRLLEIGAGSGWPALFLAARSGCDAVLVDLPLSGLRIARDRAALERLAERCTVLAADGTALPFRDASFDRIHHADVLCCTDAKLAMVKECRRVARPRALMEFSVIWLARPPSNDSERRVLRQSGPPYPDAGGDYAELLRDAGWTVLRCFDTTADFARSMDVLLDEFIARRDALLELLGRQDYEERLQRRRATREAVSLGLLKREIMLCQ